ncbi:arginine--tRNA ligase [mine drainage metagenome]|uniref:arginine--tRNA ligase n=1 Tax=mine drainage metagenome TaxID=410659 RepID=A0A1J5QJJ8_9ZZZZ
MTPTSLSALIVAALQAAATKGDLGVLTPDQIPAEVSIDRPKNREHGDYATNIALVLAKPAGVAPRSIAELLVSALGASSDIAKIEVAGPGFLNITLAASAAGALCRTVLTQGAAYGSSDLMAGIRVNLEFISANPTGPLHLGHTRWAAVGDALGRVLSAVGAKVHREFYINDRGVQMDRFGESLMAAAHGMPTPTDGYHGAYIAELANQIVAEKPELLDLPPNVGLVAFREEGYQRQLAHQQRVLDEFGTHFDVWFSERSLHQSAAVETAFAKLREQGHVYEADGATWLRTTDFGDDKDRVLRKADGELTYFASDTAYYVDKRSRGFDICIYMLGADHHGYVGRLKATAACAGDDPEKNVEVLIGQLVKIIEGGEELKLSKRAGTIITLEDIVERVGVDAARYTLIRYPVDTPMTMDVDLLTKRTNENPVFYVQYAHARISGVLRNALELGVSAELTDFDPSLLSHERESDLLGILGEFPRIVATAADLREPHRIARYLEELAGTYHRFYDACRVLPLGDEPIGPLHNARAVLTASTRQVLQNGLALLGVSAPERM